MNSKVNIQQDGLLQHLWIGVIIVALPNNVMGSAMALGLGDFPFSISTWLISVLAVIALFRYFTLDRQAADTAISQ